MAVYLVRRRPDNAVTTYFLLAVSLLAVETALDPAMTLALARYGPDGWFWIANLGFQWAAIGANVATLGAFVLFPDGIVERRWHRGLLRSSWCLLAVPPLLLVCSSVVIHPFIAGPAMPQASPFAVPWLAALGPPLAAVFSYHYVVVLLGGMVCFARYRRDADRRRRMRWLMVILRIYVAQIPLYAAALLLDLQLDLVVKQARDAVATFLDREYVRAKLAEITRHARVAITDPASTLEHVGKALRFTAEAQATILAHFIQGADITSGGVLHAVTSAAQTLDDADAAHDLERHGLRAMALAAAHAA